MILYLPFAVLDKERSSKLPQYFAEGRDRKHGVLEFCLSYEPARSPLSYKPQFLSTIPDRLHLKLCLVKTYYIPIQTLALAHGG